MAYRPPQLASRVTLSRVELEAIKVSIEKVRLGDIPPTVSSSALVTALIAVRDALAEYGPVTPWVDSTADRPADGTPDPDDEQLTANANGFESMAAMQADIAAGSPTQVVVGGTVVATTRRIDISESESRALDGDR